MAALTLGAIGVVYGDIGTSPLYTLKEIFAPRHRRAAGRGAHHRRGVVHRLGADAGGDAEVRAADPARRQPRRRRRPGAGGAGRAGRGATGRACATALLLLGVAGATLFYGDSVITPAISVLGAMEGLRWRHRRG
jgi:KUP system potassium uptake protein